MQEIVDAILHAEEESARLIDAARRSAAELKERADADATEMVKRAREQAQQIIRTRVEEATSAAKTERDRIVSEAHEQRGSFAATHAAILDPIVENIVKLVVSPEYAAGAPGAARARGDRGQRRA